MKNCKWMQRVCSVVCAVLLLALMMPVGVFAAATEYKLVDNQANYKTQGRIAWSGDALMLDWSLSGIEFEAECQGEVSITFDVKWISDTSEVGGVYFTVFVDGVAQPRETCYLSKKGSKTVVLAQNLAAGKHTFAIVRQTEHIAGQVGVTKIDMDGTFLAAPKQKDMYIEFIGDSITAAFGNLGNPATPGDHGGKPLYQDALQGYAYLTATELNADYSSICWSGIGCKYNYGGGNSFSMQDVYTRVRYMYDKSNMHDFTAREPDVVVLALGTNDDNGAPNATAKRAGLKEMLELVRAKNPNAKIVWMYGMMTSSLNTMIEEIVAELGGWEKGFYLAKTPQNNKGAGSHPNLDGQKKFAETLVKVIKEEVLNPNYAGPTTTTTTITTIDWGVATTTDRIDITTTKAEETTAAEAVTTEKETQNTTTAATEENSEADAEVETTEMTTTTTAAQATDTENSDVETQPTSSPFMWVAIALAGLAVAAIVVVIVLLVTGKKPEQKPEEKAEETPEEKAE